MDQWRWQDGTLMNYTNWAPKKPSDSSHFLLLARRKDFKWMNAGTKNMHPYICSQSMCHRSFMSAD